VVARFTAEARTAVAGSRCAAMARTTIVTVAVAVAVGDAAAVRATVFAGPLLLIKACRRPSPRSAVQPGYLILLHLLSRSRNPDTDADASTAQRPRRSSPPPPGLSMARKPISPQVGEPVRIRAACRHHLHCPWGTDGHLPGPGLRGGGPGGRPPSPAGVSSSCRPMPVRFLSRKLAFRRAPQLPGGGGGFPCTLDTGARSGIPGTLVSWCGSGFPARTGVMGVCGVLHCLAWRDG
jgi:hypothetical protein